MSEQSITLPFKIPDLFGGFAEGRGLAKLTGAELTIEIVVKDNLVNLLKSGVKEIRVPRSEIDIVRFKRGWFGGKLLIRLKSMRWLADLPGCSSGELRLRIARHDQERAAEFAQAFTTVQAQTGV